MFINDIIGKMDSEQFERLFDVLFKSLNEEFDILVKDGLAQEKDRISFNLQVSSEFFARQAAAFMITAKTINPNFNMKYNVDKLFAYVSEMAYLLVKQC